ncbi:hypothetical protein Enr10x_32210 [Gimesia panareensis]|uniref:FG-GAP repeat protein n=2 Tax=Gimesia panareensis TaxID=2527978 RepID=A0A517Q8D3_9PLAN|nr:hypothetical protein Enr10x_32210 [Gimesia panareensis]
MFLTNWLQAISARSYTRPSARNRHCMRIRQTRAPVSPRQIKTIEILEDRTLLTSYFQGELLPDVALSPFNGDLAGTAVAVSGDWLVVGSPYADPAGLQDAGAVSLYSRNEAGTPDDQTDDTWDFHSTIVSPRTENADQDYFGISVAIDGDTLLVGATEADEGDTFGSAYLFRLNPVGADTDLSNDTWDYLATLSRPTAVANDAPEDFGAAVDIKGNTAVVGAKQDAYDSLSASGAVYVFATDDDWGSVSVDKLKADDASADAWLGSSVAISDDESTIIAGAVQDQGKGAAYLFERSLGGAGVADDSWQQIKKLAGSTGSDFGSAVDIDDRYAAVGAPGDTYGGAVSILDGSVNWNIVEKYHADAYPNSTDTGGFGAAVSLDDMCLVVGDPEGNSGNGAAYLYDASIGWDLAVEDEFVSADPDSGGDYGAAIAIDAETIVSGAPLHDHGAVDTGSAYVFGFPPVIDFTTQLVNGDLFIQHQTVSDSNLTLTVSGGQLIVSATSDRVTPPTGGTQVDEQAIMISLTALSGGNIFLTGGGGSEQVTIDTSLADAGLRLNYDGGTGSGTDTLILSGTAVSLSSWMGDDLDGHIRLDNSLLQFVSYAQQDHLIWDVSVSSIDLNYSNTLQTFYFDAEAGGGFQVSGTAIPELTILQTPTDSLTFDGGAGRDDIYINSVGQNATADLMIVETKPGDFLWFGDALDLGSGDVELSVISVNFGQNVSTTGNLQIDASSITTSSTAPLNTGSGNISFESYSLNLGEIITTGNVWINAKSSIVDNNGSANNITATKAVVLTGTSTNSLETQVSYLAVDAVNFVQITNTGDLVIGDAGDLYGVRSRDSTIYINTTGSLEVRESMLAGTSMSLYAGGDITVRSGVILKSPNSSFGVSLNAGDDIVVEEGAELIALAGGVGLEAQNAVADTASGTVDLLGQVTAANGTGIYGGNNADVFHITPSRNSEISINGYSPSLPASPGDTLYYNEPADGAFQQYDSNTGQLDYAGGYQSITISGIETVQAGSSVPDPAYLLIIGTAGDDILTITATDNNSGTYQLNAGPVENFFSIASLAFYGLEGDDQLIINNPSGGVFAPEDGIYFDGGTGGETLGDRLELLGGFAIAETHHFLDESEGRVFFNDASRPTIQYSGLDRPLNSTVIVDRLALSFSGSSTLSDGGSDTLAYESDLSQLGTFLNPTMSLTVNSGNWNSGISSDIHIDSLGANFSADLNLGQGVGSETVYLADGLNLGLGSLLCLAETTQITGTITTDGNVEVSASILSFTTSTSSIEAGAGDIRLESRSALASGALTTTGDVSLIAGNGHLSLLNSTVNTITAGLLELSAVQGSILNFKTEVDQLTAVANGGINVKNTGDLILGSAAGQSAWKGLRANTSIIEIESAGSIDIQASIYAGLGILMNTLDGAANSLDEDLTVRSGVKIDAGTGQITLNTADDLLIEAGAQLVARNSLIQLNLSTFTTDFLGGALDLFGQLFALNGAQLNGSVFADTFQIAPSLNSGITLDGGNPAAPDSPADSLFYTTPPGALPSVTTSGTDSGTISFTGGLGEITYSKIEELTLQGVLWVEGTVGDDVLSVTATGADRGTFQLNGSPAVSFSGLTQLVFQGSQGDDQLSIQNPVGGLFNPVDGIVFEGGSGGETAGDSLEILRGVATSVEHRFIDESSGSILYDGNSTATISYTGLEPVLDMIDATNRSFTFTGGIESITLSDDAVADDDRSLIDSTLGESVTFLHPTGTLTINTEAGNTDTVNLNALDSSFDAHLTVTPDPGDTINVGTVDLGSGDLNLDGIVNFNGTFTTTGLIDIEADGDLTFASGGSASAGNIILYSHMNLLLGQVIASGNVELEAVGSISDANANAENIIAVNATLISGTGIGVGDALETSISALEADSGAGLEITNTGTLSIGFVDGLNGVITDGITRITSSATMTVTEEVSVAGGLLELENTGENFVVNGGVTISNDGSNLIHVDSANGLTMLPSAEITSSGNGLIDLDAVFQIALSDVNTSGEVQVTSTSGSIVDNTVTETPLISADTLVLQAATGIGGAGNLDLDTEVDSMTANTSQGPIMISNFEDLFVQLPQLLDLILNEDAPEQTIDLSQITTAGGTSQPLSVTAQSSLPSVIPHPQVNISAADTTDNLVFTPVPELSGAGTITVLITDGGVDHQLGTTGDNRTIELTFDVTVNPVNDDPELDPLADLLLLKNTPEQTVNLSGITAGGGESQPLRVTAQSSNTGLIANPVVNYTSADSTGSLVFTPITDQTGTTTITVTVEDGGLDGNLATTADNATITRTFDVSVRELETLSLRVVATPTATDSQGTAAALPSNQDSISEWEDYWVEIWVSTEDNASQGIASVSLDLSYLTDFTSATEIEYGSAFSLNQGGVIDDQTGLIANLAATADLADLGINTQLLFARIHFETLADDQVLLDFDQQSIGPHDLALQMQAPEVSLGSGRTSQTPIIDSTGADIWANPYDLNDDDAINFRDLILFVTAYNSVPAESSSDYAWFSDYNQNQRVEFHDLVYLVSNYNRLKSQQLEIQYPDNYPDAWNQQLQVSILPQAVQATTPSLTQNQADTMLQTAVHDVSPNLTEEHQQQLAHVKVEVVDLQGATVGRAVGDTIYIDINAAGYGWFVDDTPLDHSEYQYESQLSLIAIPGSAAAGLIDLWTVIQHELGHLLGYEHQESGVMEATLDPGVRKLSDWNETTDDFFAALKEQTEMLSF